MRASKARTGHRTGRTVSQALERIRQVATATSPLHTQGGSRVREFRMHGSVRGAAGNSRPYRDRGASASPNRLGPWGFHLLFFASWLEPKKSQKLCEPKIVE